MDRMVRNDIACNCIPFVRIAFRYAHISFNCIFEAFNCVFTQIHCLSRVLLGMRGYCEGVFWDSRWVNFDKQVQSYSP